MEPWESAKRFDAVRGGMNVFGRDLELDIDKKSLNTID
jgi:hypothetical protein